MNNLATIINDLKKFTKNFENNKVKVINKNNIVSKRYIFLYSLLLSKKLDNIYGDIFKEYILKVEKIFPSSSINLIKYLFENREEFKTSKQKATIKLFKKYLLDLVQDELYVNKFLDIINFSGPDSIINIHETKLKNQIIKRKESKFDINVNKNFYSIFFTKSKLVKRSCGVVIVDGFIEKDQHLIPAIEFCKENNKTFLLVCRGMTSQVSKFLKTCILKNKMTCIVYEKRFDDNDPFLFEDMAIASGISLIKDYTSLALDIKKNISIIDNVILQPESVSFNEQNEKIIKKIKELKSLNLDKDFIYKRIKRLSGKKVDVYCKDPDFIEFLKYSIKIYNKILKFGIYKSDNNNIISALEYDLINSIKSELEDKLKKIRFINYAKDTKKE